MAVVFYRLALAGGLALLTYGVALWSVPAAFVAGGVCLATAGFAGLYGVTAGDG